MLKAREGIPDICLEAIGKVSTLLEENTDTPRFGKRGGHHDSGKKSHLVGQANTVSILHLVGKVKLGKVRFC